MNTSPKILLYDIETAPNLAYVWGKYEQDVIDLERSWYMLCFAAKWADSKSIMAYGLSNFPLYKKDKENDKELVQKLWELINEADIVIAHNGDEFDIKKTNSRFIEHGLNPPSPYKTIDTKKVAKRYFRFDSNKLDDLGQYLKLGRKLKTGGFDLWKGCMTGNKKAWKTMLEYNKQDVVLLEKVYLKLRPWIRNHPNFNVYRETPSNCKNCGSEKMQLRGFSYTTTGKAQRVLCMTCGTWSLGKNIKFKDLQVR